MTDTFIQQVADDNRALARQMLDWELDDLRLHAGLVEVVEPDRPEIPLARRTRRLLAAEPRDTRLFFCRRTCAPYAHFHEIRDKVPA